MTKRTVQRTDFLGDFHQLLDSEEGEKSMEALDAVGEVLHDADVDITERRIIWSDGKRLSVDQTAERIHKQSGADISRIKIHVIGWLEMGFVPNGLNEKEMELFEIQIGDWVDDYEAVKFS
jgi:hypothetical protein